MSYADADDSYLIKFKQLPSYRLKAAQKISLHIGRLYRGYIARRTIQFFRWNRYNDAARTIQNMFRRWKGLKSYQIAEAKIRRLRMYHPSMIVASDTMKSFRNLISGQGVYEDQMTIWRLVIDLRRAHPSHSTDNCIKAVLESKGEANRAITLLGLPAFASRHFDDLSKQYKMLFMPSVHGRTLYSEKQTCILQGTASRSIKILKSRKFSGKRSRYTMPMIAKDVSQVLDSIYFSKQQSGSRVVTSKYRKIYAPSLDENRYSNTK